MTIYWEQAGHVNTAATAKAAATRCRELGLTHLVVASNTGATARHFLGQGLTVVMVTHHVGFKGPGVDELEPAVRAELAAAGVKILTTTHLFGNVERAVIGKFGGAYPGALIAGALRAFGEGTKVCLEIAVMALDAGLIPYGVDVVAVAGSGGGADTAIVVRPAHARDYFDTWVPEIIAKPRSRERA
ncbi:MAG: pyruvate kinase alpha/beta domain-containing protein [Bacillota bacterium]